MYALDQHAAHKLNHIPLLDKVQKLIYLNNTVAPQDLKEWKSMYNIKVCFIVFACNKFCQ